LTQLTLIHQTFDLTPEGIVNTLNLKNPIFAQSAALGHFGRQCFSWEQLDKVDLLKKTIAKYLVTL